MAVTIEAGGAVCDWCGDAFDDPALRITVLHEDGTVIVVHRPCLAGLRRLSLEELRQLSLQTS